MSCIKSYPVGMMVVDVGAARDLFVMFDFVLLLSMRENRKGMLSLIRILNLKM